MARMLQALKNLEARSPAKSAPKPKAPPAPPVVVLEPAVAVVDRPVELPKRPAIAPAAPPVAESLDALAGHLASLEIAIEDSPGRFELDRVAATPYSPPAPKTAAGDTGKPPPATVAAPSRTICETERLVRRTLDNSGRAKPLTELAARLRQDMQQTGAKTLAFAGVGSSATHEALLYAATLLAEQSSGNMLLVDGNVDRRPLTEALEFGRERGLAELLQSEMGGADLCQPTGAEKLIFLPAGLSALASPAVQTRWPKILEQLKTRFDAVLIDIGQASDPTASTLARTADATYLVVQLGAVETSEAQAALAGFRAAGARLLGCIAT